jgi:hypothetical protein
VSRGGGDRGGEPSKWGIAGGLRDCGFVVSLRDFEDRLAGEITSKYAPRDLSPVSKKAAVEVSLSSFSCHVYVCVCMRAEAAFWSV